MESNEDFREYRVAILEDLKRLNGTMGKLQDIVMTLTVEVGQLKVTDRIRSSLWGGLGGIFTAAAVMTFIELLLKDGGK